MATEAMLQRLEVENPELARQLKQDRVWSRVSRGVTMDGWKNLGERPWEPERCGKTMEKTAVLLGKWSTFMVGFAHRTVNLEGRLLKTLTGWKWRNATILIVLVSLFVCWSLGRSWESWVRWSSSGFKTHPCLGLIYIYIDSLIQMSKVAFLRDLNITFRWFCWVMKPYQLSRSYAQERQSNPRLKGCIQSRHLQKNTKCSW